MKKCEKCKYAPLQKSESVENFEPSHALQLSPSNLSATEPSDGDLSPSNLPAADDRESTDFLTGIRRDRAGLRGILRQFWRPSLSQYCCSILYQLMFNNTDLIRKLPKYQCSIEETCALCPRSICDHQSRTSLN